MIKDEFLYVEKYRPRVIDDIMLPASILDKFKSVVDGGEIQHMLLVGGPGTGKTTAARAMCEQLGVDYMVINASSDGNIDMLRTTLTSFASTVSLNGGYKVVILDEADHLNPKSTQPALRNFMEKFSKNCRFIMTANYKHKIIEPLQSRMTTVDFTFSKKDRAFIAAKFAKSVFKILEAENVEFDKRAIAKFIMQYSPDMRKTLNELQSFAMIGGVIDSESLECKTTVSFDELISHLTKKDFKSLNNWIGENLDTDGGNFMSVISERIRDIVKSSSMPDAVLIMNEYDYRSAFVADKSLNCLAMCVNIMTDCELVSK